MKHVSMLARLVSLLAIGVTAPLAFGMTTAQTYIDSYRGRTDIPVPVKVVAPRAGAALAGTRAEVAFLVDATGRPQGVRVLSATDDAFGASVRAAVKQWRFEPAKSNGAPVARKVLLPVLVRESE